MEERENRFAPFANADLQDWEHAAQEELKGADPWKRLTHEENGILVKPFYSPDKTRKASFRLPQSNSGFLGSRAWYNCPLVQADNPQEANETALQHLRQGADGVFFELEEPVDFETLLKGIEWPSCSLNFLAKKNERVLARELNAYMKKKYYREEVTSGAFFGNLDALPPRHLTFSMIGHRIVSSGSPLDELANGIKVMEQATRDHFVQRAAEVAFSVEIGPDFFLEIAKLRALRIVWDKLLTWRKVMPGTPVFVHAWSGAWNDKSYSPHGNMLKGTTAVMAAILGGCNALTVESEDHEQVMMNRVARNISNILREESHFSKVADPLCGSYFIEDLTQQLVEGVWKTLLVEMKP